jgi:hypothetical protein
LWSVRAAPACDNDAVPPVDLPNTTRLQHVAVLGGSVAEWNQLSEAQWAQRLRELGKAADHFGASWLTVRPYLAGEGHAPRRSEVIGGCAITVDPEGDGRGRLLRVLNELRAEGVPLTEHSVASRINAPALADPDLVVVLGPATRMPVTLVWELAYSELVFVDVAWPDLHASHLEQAMSDFASRHRRFGGID